jgi:hypothetical protein
MNTSFAENKNVAYKFWKDNKAFGSLFPALFFWLASVIFFLIGMTTDNQMNLWGINWAMPISIGLALSNTVIQIIGNDADDLDPVTYMIWIASYALGIGTNVVGLMKMLSFSNIYLEWIICVSLGVIIEVSPEKLLVRFLKNWRGKSKRSPAPGGGGGGGGGQPKPAPKPAPTYPRPAGIPNLNQPSSAATPRPAYVPPYKPVGFPTREDDTKPR